MTKQDQAEGLDCELASSAGDGDTTEVTPVRSALLAAKAESLAELTRTISELNELRMRLDAIVRRLKQTTNGDSEQAGEIETLRLRLLGKLDRVREKLVTRLSEERRTKAH